MMKRKINTPLDLACHFECNNNNYTFLRQATSSMAFSNTTCDGNLSGHLDNIRST